MFAKLFVLVLVTLYNVQGYNNGLGELPALGWNSWCTDGPCQRDVCYEKTVKEVADAMVTTGLKDLGYTYINLDDCWASIHRDPTTGALQPNATRFPSGMKAVADYVHSKGLKFGIYTASGVTWCMHPWMQTPDDKPIPGSYNHYDVDVKTFVEWGVDYIKLDWCQHGKINGTVLEPKWVYPHVSGIVNKTGRHIWFAACDDRASMWLWGAPYLQSWRMAHDHHDDWTGTATIIESMAGKSPYGKPFGWNDFDFIHTGGQGCGSLYMKEPMPYTHCPGMTDLEYYTEYTMWVIVNSPLLIATDIRNMTKLMRDILLDRDILAIHQDKLAKSGDRLGFSTTDNCPMGTCQVWGKPLASGEFALVFYNADDSKNFNVEVNLSMIGDGWNKATVYDLWERKSVGIANGFWAASTAPHGVKFYRLKKLMD